MKTLFRKKPTETDIRAAFFALASLMMILLPTLLMVTNPEKMVSLPLSLSNGQSQLIAPHSGIVEKIMVRANSDSFEVEVRVEVKCKFEVKSNQIETIKQSKEKITLY